MRLGQEAPAAAQAGGELAVAEHALDRAGHRGASIGTTSASRSGSISSRTHGRSDTTTGHPHAIASQTDRGELSEDGIDTQTSAAW